MLERGQIDPGIFESECSPCDVLLSGSLGYGEQQLQTCLLPRTELPFCSNNSHGSLHLAHPCAPKP